MRHPQSASQTALLLKVLNYSSFLVTEILYLVPFTPDCSLCFSQLPTSRKQTHYFESAYLVHKSAWIQTLSLWIQWFLEFFLFPLPIDSLLPEKEKKKTSHCFAQCFYIWSPESQLLHLYQALENYLFRGRETELPSIWIPMKKTRVKNFQRSVAYVFPLYFEHGIC